MTTTKDYLNLITSEHQDKPNYMKTVALDVAVQVRVQNLLDSMIGLFDIDNATGAQLDVIGKWAGISRNISIPIAGVFFSWDAAPTLGWDYGSWQDTVGQANITSLPDDAYRNMIRAKIAANKWDGTTDGAYAIWDEIFPQFTILIQDNQNMSYAMALVGGIVDSLTLALLVGGYLPLRPEGVLINQYYVSVDSGPVFSWDLNSDLLKGWDQGSWVREVAPT